ncbi:hypothetical protein FRB99_005010 [Tulasnella sp. 403]|nr:hypothetical protein FRB99_005010 [Tulasnella sp. 403]
MAPNPTLLSLPLEIAHHTIGLTSPTDLASLALTCKLLHSIIYTSTDRYIWREIFLRIWDDPRVRTHLDTRQGLPLTSNAELEAALSSLPYDWRTELQRRIRAQNLIQNKRLALVSTCSQRKNVFKVFLAVVRSASPAVAGRRIPEAKNAHWLWNTLKRADACNYNLWPSLHHDVLPFAELVPDFEELALRCELHTYIGLTQSDLERPQKDDPVSITLSQDDFSVVNIPTLDIDGQPGSSQEIRRYYLRSPSRPASLPQCLYSNPFSSPGNLRNAARAFVYDLRNYTRCNLWAPLLNDLRGGYKAHWRHLDYLMIVILWNLREEGFLIHSTPDEYLETRPCPPMELAALRPWSAPGWEAQITAALDFDAKQAVNETCGTIGEKATNPPLSNTRPFREWEDWAGVEGKWQRVVCFMDYQDLFRYNFQNRLSTSVFEEDGFQEEVRVMDVELRITSIEPRDAPASRTYSETAKRLNRPRIHFVGRSQGGRPHESKVVGFVECLESGDIRWHMVSSYGGEDRWSSEGVQVGGVGSARGIIGTWSGIDHEPGDPAGPFWLWKIGGRDALPSSFLNPPSTNR